MVSCHRGRRNARKVVTFLVVTRSRRPKGPIGDSASVRALSGEPAGKGGGVCGPFEPGQCTCLAFQKRPDVYYGAVAHGVPAGGTRAAGSQFYVWDGEQWLVNARRAGIPTGSQPVAGALVVWGVPNSAAYGHVAYVERATSATHVLVSECNYDFQGHCRTIWENPQAAPHLQGYVYGGPAGNGPGSGPPGGGSSGPTGGEGEGGEEVASSSTLWGIDASGRSMRYAGNANWTFQGGPAFADIAASASTVAALSTAGQVYTYTGNGTWHLVSGASLGHIAVTETNTLWGIDASGRSMRYAGNANWTFQGGPAFADIAASASTVAALSTAGQVYTYTGNGTWHLVSGASLGHIAVTETNTLWGIDASGRSMRYAGNANWTFQGGPAFADIAASASTVAALSTAGQVYTYTGNGTWHLVSGASLGHIAVQ